MAKLLAWLVPPMMGRSQLVFLWMTGVFLTCLVVANLIGSYLFSFTLPFDTPLGSVVLLSAGIIPFPVTFILTDLLNEFYGKQAARFVTMVGFAMSILVFVFLAVGEKLPVDPQSPFKQAEYLHFSGMYTGMFVASLTAYLVGQLLDIQVFHIFRTWTKHRYLWLRAQGSTVISQMFDSLIVTFVAFWDDLPASALWQLAAGNYTWKFLIVVLITPLLYIGHAVLRRSIGWQEDMVERIEPEYAGSSAE